MRSIILIGMPGAGKSTVGVILAKAANLEFCDTDLIIQKNENMLLQDIIEKKGSQYFKKCEEIHIRSNDYNNMVVATGGSVVYSKGTMQHLKSFGTVIYLNVPIDELEIRIGDFSSRGVIGSGTVKEIFAQREDLYKKYADITINCNNLTIEQTVTEVLKQLAEWRL